MNDNSNAEVSPAALRELIESATELSEDQGELV